MDDGQFLIVGVGASAGGIEAFQTLLKATPPESNLAYVLVLHLPPDGSHLPEILARHTQLRVREIEDGMRVEPNQVYVIRPAHYLRIKDGILQLQEPQGERVARAPVDIFFRSLAEDRRERAACVILSGTGSNGSMGLREIKGHGGLTVVQDPETAAFDGMPRSALNTGAVDLVLPLEGIAAALAEFATHDYVKGKEPSTPKARRESDLEAIVRLLRVQTRYDFGHYKKGTLQRRIARRMGVRNVGSTSQYRQLLEQNPGELRELHRDLLIRVTNFFRDPAAFEVFEREVVPQLVADCHEGDSLRAWVPACATGEEAFTIAMLLHAGLRKARKSMDLKVFASDVDEESIRLARLATYPEAIAEDVPEPYLRQYFVRQDSGYRVSKTLRECVIFAPQDVVDDPPFSKMNLVSCRNLLIYLQPEVQRRVLRLLHFALNEGGYLLLGSAETIGEEANLFTPVVKRHRIFRRIGPKGHIPADFPGGVWEPRMLPEPAVGAVPFRGLADTPFTGWARKLIMEFYAPACVIVDREQRVLFYSGATGKYFAAPAGEPTRKLTEVIRPELASVLTTAVARAIDTDQAVLVAGELQAGGGPGEVVNIAALPLKSPKEAEGLVLVSFEDRRAAPGDATPQAIVAGEEGYVQQLEHDLAAAQDSIHLNTERIAGVLEAHQAANEEVRSMNEELQSINEELVTSKEELQSLNEELLSVNQQLETKVQELETTNDDLANLLRSTDLATLFLNRELCIRRFTPALIRLINLLPSDLGRPFSDIAPKFTDEDLIPHCRRVLESLVPLEKEITGPDGRWYLRTVLPYRTEEERIDGVVITFGDITARKRAEASLEEMNQFLKEDVDDLRRLQDVSRGLVRAADVQKVLGDVLVAAVVVMRADMGDIHLLDHDSGRLVLRDHVGFDAEAVVAMQQVTSEDACSSGRALALGRRVVFRDLDDPVTHPPGDPRLLDLLRAAGVRAMQSTPLVSRQGRVVGMISTYYRERHEFDDRELRLLDVLVRQAADAIERAMAIAALREREQRASALNQSLEQAVALRTLELQLLQDVTVIANAADSVEEALRRSLERICTQLRWEAGHAWLMSEEGDLVDSGIWYLPADGPCSTLQQTAQGRRFQPGEGLVGEVAASGRPKWIPEVAREPGFRRTEELAACGLTTAVAFPILLGSRVAGVLELFCQDRLEPDAELLAALAACGAQLGRVVERERLEREIAFATTTEQRLIGQELHDAVSQELTGITIFTERLREELQHAGAPQAAELEKLLPHLKSVQRQVRRISHGLMPVEVTPEGLMIALERLAESEQALCGVSCRFECPRPVLVENNAAATQLYRIAQEAIQNAAKHADATAVTIELSEDGETGVELVIRDNGRGISPQSFEGDGIGLRIMQHRASLIGAQLIVFGPPEGGTLVHCLLRKGKLLGDFPVLPVRRADDDRPH